MNRWFRIGMMMVVCGVCRVRPVSAVNFEVNLNPGYAVPVGGTADQLDPAFSFNFSGLFEVASGLFVGPEFGYTFSQKAGSTQVSRNDFDNDGLPDVSRINADFNRATFHLTPMVKWNLPMDTQEIPFQPYVVGGVGLYHAHLPESTGSFSAVGTTVGPVSGTATIEETSEDNAGFFAGGGLTVKVGDWKLGAQMRFHTILYKSADNIKYIEPSLQAGYTF